MANTTNLDLVKPLGTDHALISVINGNMDKVDAYAGKVNDSLAAVQDGLAIVAVGDTHAAITSGQFVYVKEHNTLPEGLYTASANIAANGALSTSNLTADSKGGLNALSDQIGAIGNSRTWDEAVANCKIIIVSATFVSGTSDVGMSIAIPVALLSNSVRYWQVSDAYNGGEDTHFQVKAKRSSCEASVYKGSTLQTATIYYYGI